MVRKRRSSRKRRPSKRSKLFTLSRQVQPDSIMKTITAVKYHNVNAIGTACANYYDIPIKMNSLYRPMNYPAANYTEDPSVFGFGGSTYSVAEADAMAPLYQNYRVYDIWVEAKLKQRYLDTEYTYAQFNLLVTPNIEPQNGNMEATETAKVIQKTTMPSLLKINDTKRVFIDLNKDKGTWSISKHYRVPIYMNEKVVSLADSCGPCGTAAITQDPEKIIFCHLVFNNDLNTMAKDAAYWIIEFKLMWNVLFFNKRPLTYGS